MKRSRLCASLAIGLPLLISCSDVTEANNKNFAEAINRELATRKACVELYLPAKIRVVDGDQQAHHPREEPLLNALVEAGVLSTNKEDLPDDGFTIGEPKKYPHLVYGLTAKGAASVKEENRSAFARAQTSLCYGKGEVTEITNFSAPADVMGMRVSQVQYQYKVGDVADWAKATAVANADDRIGAAARGDAFSDKSDLVLTAKGWQTHQEFSRGNRTTHAAAQ